MSSLLACRCESMLTTLKRLVAVISSVQQGSNHYGPIGSGGLISTFPPGLSEGEKCAQNVVKKFPRLMHHHRWYQGWEASSPRPRLGEALPWQIGLTLRGCHRSSM
eukprot:65809-Pelagomonas_calceolata.AAC.2